MCCTHLVRVNEVTLRVWMNRAMPLDHSWHLMQKEPEARSYCCRIHTPARHAPLVMLISVCQAEHLQSTAMSAVKGTLMRKGCVQQGRWAQLAS